jgi:hypothetical protein
MARVRATYVGERRTAYFGFQLTPQERRNLERHAEERGMLMAEFVRSHLPLGAPANDAGHQRRRAREIADLLGALGRIGNNLNQLAHHANETRRLPEAALLREAITELKAAFSRIV